MKKIVISLVIAGLAGCATSPDKIQASSVSTLQYKDYSCTQVSGELDRVSRRANELHQSLNTKANNDTAQMAIGMVLFWPALFLLEGGDGPEAAEYARLKGEREALEKVALQRECGIVPATVQQTPAPQQDAVPEKAAAAGASGV